MERSIKNRSSSPNNTISLKEHSREEDVYQDRFNLFDTDSSICIHEKRVPKKYIKSSKTA